LVHQAPGVAALVGGPKVSDDSRENGESNMSDAWPMIKAEREACADAIEKLSAEQLATPSLCQGWSVRDVAGHMIATGEMTFGSFYSNLLKAGLRFNEMAGRLMTQNRDGEPATLAQRLRDKAAGPNHPPGPLTAMLGEAVVHGEDIRRPLGLTRNIPDATLVAVADFYKKSNLVIGAKKRIAGLKLQATDVDWRHGDGPEVTGPMASLVVAMTGRKPSIDDLSGEGVATLRSRR
jgi:uncharacterized protein (TIGR03083 family)